MSIFSTFGIMPISSLSAASTESKKVIQGSPIQKLREPFQGVVADEEREFLKKIQNITYQSGEKAASQFVFEFFYGLSADAPKLWTDLFDRVVVEERKVVFEMDFLNMDKLMIFRMRLEKVQKFMRARSEVLSYASV